MNGIFKGLRSMKGYIPWVEKVKRKRDGGKSLQLSKDISGFWVFFSCEWIVRDYPLFWITKINLRVPSYWYLKKSVYGLVEWVVFTTDLKDKCYIFFMCYFYVYKCCMNFVYRIDYILLYFNYWLHFTSILAWSICI